MTIQQQDVLSSSGLDWLDATQYQVHSVTTEDESHSSKEKLYKFKTVPKDKSGGRFINSSCWRGYISHYHVTADGRLRLEKYVHLSDYEQPVGELCEGEFWLHLMDQELHILSLPFVSGELRQDFHAWGFSRFSHPWLKCDELSLGEIEKKAIESEVVAKGITELVHFTRIENVPNILDHGLQGRATLDESDASYVYSDELRLDGQPDSISVSISFPNYQMFYRKRLEDLSKQWVVFKLDPAVMWEKSCLFCMGNAASTAIAHGAIEGKVGFRGFESMFADIPGDGDRHVYGLPEKYPTSPQAEVLVLESIEPEWIREVHVETREGVTSNELFMNSFKKHGERVRFAVGSEMFSARKDYERWRAF